MGGRGDCCKLSNRHSASLQLRVRGSTKRVVRPYPAVFDLALQRLQEARGDAELPDPSFFGSPVRLGFRSPAWSKAR